MNLTKREPRKVIGCLDLKNVPAQWLGSLIMRTHVAVACLIVFGSVAALAQQNNYDSRVETPPHYFSWEDTYDYVDIWDSAHVDINGGFLYSVKLRDKATGTVSSGQVSGLSAYDDSSILVLGADCELVRATDRARIDLYDCNQSGLAQVWTMHDGIIRIFGGNYGIVNSMAESDGRIEVSASASIGHLLSSWKGMAFQRGGRVTRFDASSGGVSVLDDGEVSDLMSVGGSSTLVLAGGYPAPDIRLFEDARLLILHTGNVEPDYVSYQLSDFDRPGANENCAAKKFTVALDGDYKNFLVSAWTNTGYSSDNVWRGRVELVKIGNDIRAFGLKGDTMIVAFQAPANEVIQVECSTNLVSWQPWKSAIPGDHNVHVEGLRIKNNERLYLRLRKWPKPGS